MGAGSSQQVPCYPPADYRHFYEYPTLKTSNNYIINSPPSDVEQPPRYRAIVHEAQKKKGSEGSDIELFEADEDAKDGIGPSAGMIKSTKEGLKFALGDVEESNVRYESLSGASRKKPPLRMLEFSYAAPTAQDAVPGTAGNQVYVWSIVRYTGLGNVREILLRVKPEGEPQAGDEKSEEKGGEIVAIWKKKGWLKSGEGSFWVKTRFKQSLPQESARTWEDVVVLTGLSVVEGWWH